MLNRRLIKERRKELKLRADDIAEQLGINRVTYYRYESGDLREMRASRLFRLAEILQVRPFDLIMEDEKDEEAEI